MIVELSKRTIIIDNNTTKDVVDEDIRAFIESELALAMIGKYDVTRKEKRNRSKPTSSQTITYPSSPLERLQRADSISTPVSVVESGSHEGSSLGTFRTGREWCLHTGKNRSAAEKSPVFPVWAYRSHLRAFQANGDRPERAV